MLLLSLAFVILSGSFVNGDESTEVATIEPCTTFEKCQFPFKINGVAYEQCVTAKNLPFSICFKEIDSSGEPIWVCLSGR